MMKANQQRYWDALMELGTITDAALPYTRRSFSDTFLKGRQWISERMQQLGMPVHVDAAGNLVGSLAGRDKNAGVIAIGSHSDTVPGGGRFDGVAGVVAGLECVASLQERNIKLNHTLEVIDFLAEEPVSGASLALAAGVSVVICQRIYCVARTRRPASSSQKRSFVWVASQVPWPARGYQGFF
ncbi:allantoate amidohydrolase [Advenella kashmirensis WT001]|uniref:Allantoate amidohydrolase n=1 Tax=Advenella kashmirensis (strain DSM 17095 / LMG 22695 / WT001) TaxID=1036672 RepID=I3UBQ7_ADVKW|nr:M20/M25/M40 family metallo-hydrolase [Advenella kashmirensis]AFK62445.1 allantoate amidohydrolase [Advenella kashmirensis WT001]